MRILCLYSLIFFFSALGFPLLRRSSLIVKHWFSVCCLVVVVDFCCCIDISNFPGSRRKDRQAGPSVFVAVSSVPIHRPRRFGPPPPPNQTQSCHQIDHHFRRIELRRCPKFAGRVIVGVLVVIIVPTFSGGKEGHKGVFGRVRQRIVRAIAPQVRCRIHQPRAVQHVHVPKTTSDEKAVPG